MVRQTNPRKNQQQRNESDEIPLKIKRKAPKEKYSKRNNWLEEVDDFDLNIDENIDLYGEEDYNFEDELGSDFDAEYDDDFDE